MSDPSSSKQMYKRRSQALSPLPPLSRAWGPLLKTGSRKTCQNVALSRGNGFERFMVSDIPLSRGPESVSS